MKNNNPVLLLIMLSALLSTLFVNQAKAQSVYINEILASNSNVNSDANGDNDDWIELYNADTIPIDIGGMYLTDNLTNLTKWNIPANQPLITTIPPDGYLLIWCDDEIDQGTLHAPFKLSSSGEGIALVAANGSSIIHSYTFGAQSANVSIGLEQDGQLPWTFFSTPTPESSNGSGNPVAAMPIATQSGGHYNLEFSVSLSTTTTDGTIRYTTNGDEPNDNDDEYTGPILIDETTVLRARTFSDDTEPSRTMTHTYLFNIDHEFPIFCLSTDDDNFYDDDDGIYINWEEAIEHPVHVELFEADGTFGFRQDLGIQIHGRHSQSYPHKGLAFRAKNQYGNNKINYPLFPSLPYDEYGSFILRASGNDWRSMLCRDALSSSLVRDMADVDSLIKDPDLDLQGYRPTIVYLNGEYFGIHNLREKMDYRYVRTHYGIEKNAADLVANEGNLEHGELDAWEAYQGFIEEADFQNPADLAELQTNIDLDHFFDYFIFNIYIDNNDWPGNNNRRWRLREDGAKWRFFIYDLDGSLGLKPLSDNFNSGEWWSESIEMVMADTKSEDHNDVYSTLLLRKLMENDDMRIKFINRMADQLNILFTTERLMTRIDEFQTVYAPEIAQHTDLWWEDDDWEEDFDVAREFVQLRDESVFEQVADYFTDNVDEVVDLTLNASPAAGGEIHLNTMNLYEAQFPWSGSHFSEIDVPLHTVPNPGYTFTGWTPSSLGNDPVTTMHLLADETITANFSLGSTQIGNIVINEINYNSPAFADAGDWVELHNAGSEDVDVSAWFLEDESGNYFNIPANTTIEAGGFLVLVQDDLKFSTIHPLVTNFVSNFGNNSITGSFGLGNGGEWIAINNANRSFQDTVRYDDVFPWPSAADGTGPSLSLINPSLDNALGQSWFALATDGETPGEANQGSLELGNDLNVCNPSTFTLNAAFAACFNCTYAWNNGSNQSSITVSPSSGNNNYTVTVTDGWGIVSTDSIAINISPSINVAYEVQNPLCTAAANGTIDLDINGTGTFNYNWSNGANTPTIQNLNAGTYTVTVTNDLACTQTQTVELIDPPNLLIEPQATETLCYNTLGAINPIINGGTTPYDYLWSNNATTESIIELSEGNYSLTVTDANGCIQNTSYQLETAEAIVGTFDVQASCVGGSQGGVETNISGGIGNYSYNWSNGVSGTTSNINDLNPGLYQLTVTDEIGCSWIGETEINIITEMSTDFDVSPLNCFGDNSGMVSMSVNGGEAPYSFSWDNQQTGESIENLPAGTVVVTITDDEQCQHVDSIFIPEPTPVQIASGVTPVSCFGGEDGEISLTVSGGSGNFTYDWDNGEEDAEINNLNEGTYNITITDNGNCEQYESFIISQPTLITADLQTEQISCFGDANGSISITASGGTGTLSYAWNSGATVNTINNLEEGNYEVTISDENNCAREWALEINEPDPIDIDSETEMVTCFEGENGEININASGGTGTLSYNWNNGETIADLNNLTAGFYELTITDNANCSLSESFTISQGEQISTSISIEQISCFDGANGEINVIASGGTGDLTYEWSNDEDDPEIDNLSAGTYELTITDDENCSVQESLSLTQPPFIIANFQTQAISCSGDTDGIITITASGGTGALSYEWNNGETGTTISNLDEGEYEVTITDENNCEQEWDVELSEPDPIVLTSDTEMVDCFDGATGQISITASGGTGTLSYNWNNGETLPDLDNLTAGTYELTITDNANCSQFESFTITQSDPFVTAITTEPINCFEGATGEISVIASGASGDFTYEWSNGEDEPEIENLSAGTYELTITDDANCSHYESILIDQAMPIIPDLQIEQISCSGEEDGNIFTTASGGTGDLNYEWSNGETGDAIEDLTEGNYLLTITDENNCQEQWSIDISEPSAIMASSQLGAISCFDEADGEILISASGGTGTLNYEWSNGETGNMVGNLSEGNYELTISDDNNCEIIQSFSFDQPLEIIPIAQLAAITCFDGTDGQISITASGGTGTLNYQWSNGETGNIIDNLSEGIYDLSISDDNDCEVIESFSIDQPSSLIGESTNVNPTDAMSGNISIDPSGGVSPYTILWEDGATDFQLDDLTAGTYSYTLTDANDCIFEDTITLDFISSVDGLDNSSLLIYPNPTNGIVYIKSDLASMTVVVYDFIGRPMRQFSREAAPLWKLDLSHLSPGVYCFKIQSNGLETLQMVVVD